MECSLQPSLRLLLIRAGRQAGKGLRDALAPLGLEPRHYLLLRGVEAMPCCSQQAIAAGVEIPPSRMVALVDELEERKLLERVPNPGDRRAYALRLTPAGKRLLTKAQVVADAHEAALTDGLHPDEKAVLVELLSRVAERHG